LRCDRSRDDCQEQSRLRKKLRDETDRKREDRSRAATAEAV